MTYSQERDEFIGLMVAEGVSVTTARKLLSAANTLQKLAELEVSSEAADRDRVPCPGAPRLSPGGNPIRPRGACICDLFCVVHGFGQCAPVCTPKHNTVTRIARQAQRLEVKVSALCAKSKLEPLFGGDPRGAVLKVKVPSGKYNGWGGKEDGICVPSKGFTTAQMERICR